MASAKQNASTSQLEHGVLLPYQAQWISDKSPVKIVEKSRRVGITWGEASDSALDAAAEKGNDTWYIGYNKDMALEFIETVATWAKAFQASIDGVDYDAGDVLDLEDSKRGILAYRIRFASGHKVVALSSRPSNLRGKQGRVVLDEFAFHPEAKELLKAALALTIWGGRIIIISTHDGVDNPFNELIAEVRARRKNYSLHRITFDEAIAQGLYRRVCAKLGREWTAAGEQEWRDGIVADYGEDADEELNVIPRSTSGSFLSSALIEKRMDETIPVLRLERPAEFVFKPEAERISDINDWLEEHVAPLLATLKPYWPTFFGQDFGRHSDLSTIWPIQMQPDLKRRPPFVLEMRQIPFEQQKQVLWYIVDRLPCFLKGVLDAGGNGASHAEVAMQRYGADRIEQLKFTEEWYRVNMPPLRAAFEDDFTVLPLDGDILGDHRAIRMIRGVARVPELRTTGSDGKKRHGDSAIAHALGYYATLAEIVEYGYEPVRGTRSSDDARRTDDEDDDARRFAGRGAY